MAMFSFLAAAIIAGGMAANDGGIQGDYVEAHTASVFAGACHYNGEQVTTGRDAVLAWHVTSGRWKGVDLAGVNAVAAVTSDLSLGDSHGVKRSELVIDSSASDSQAKAFAEAIKSRLADSLGTVVSVKRGTIHFSRDDAGAYSVDAGKFAALSVEPMPDAACCKQPNLVWGSPLTPVPNRKVGYTDKAAYEAGTLGEAWQRDGENSAFYGTFSF